MRRAILMTTLLLATGGAAVAADNGIYLGASVGQSQVKIDDIDTGLGTEDFDADDTSYKLIAGIRPLDFFGIEASYVNFGDAEDTVGGMRLRAEGDGISAFAVGFLGLGPVDLFAKGGLISWDTKLAGGFDEDGTDLAYGVGAQFRLLSLAVRAEYEIFDVEDVDDLDMLSIGVTYTFL